jgi:hypothetical protein
VGVLSLKRILGLFLVALLTLVGCVPPAAPTATPLVPQTLLGTVIENLQQLKTFRMIIEQSGTPYLFRVTLDQGNTETVAQMRSARAQYQNPNVLYADTRLSLGGLPPIGVEIFARGSDQWFKLIGSDWLKYTIAEGFDPGQLIQDDSGFPAALSKLKDLTYVGEETLDTGEVVIHVRGLAEGQVINDLMFGLLQVSQDNINVDVFVEKTALLPVLLLVTLPDTATEDTPQDTQWRIEVYDVNAPLENTGPAVSPEATATVEVGATEEASATVEAQMTAEATTQP